MKYLIIREQDGFEFPVFCLAPTTHADVAAAWRRDFSRQVVAAGFVEFLAGGVQTFGSSVSLDLGPRPEDAKIIAAFYRHTLRVGRATGMEPQPINPTFAAFR